MNTKIHPSGLLALVLALVLLLASVPAVQAAGSFQAVVSVELMKVYAQKAPHELLGALPQGTVVTVESYSGNAAVISYNGKKGIAKVSDMTRLSDEGAGQQETAQPGTTMVANRETRIFRKASTSSKYATVASGTQVQVLAVKGNCAKVSYAGSVGYMVYSHLSPIGATATPEATPAPTPTPQPTQTGKVTVVTTQAVNVYENADFTGSFVTVPEGTKLTLVATQGNVGMVERDGAIGFLDLAYVRKDEEKQEGTGKGKGGGNPFSAGSNQYKIYDFLINKMGYNRAAAMGLMANIKYESDYRPVLDGDSGTSFGLCQWHASRKSNLINWCKQNGYDYKTVEGQMWFLKHELTTSYTSVHKYMQQVEDSADGAYDAGYYFCFNFEAPAARTSQSKKRGAYARDTLYPMK